MCNITLWKFAKTLIVSWVVIVEEMDRYQKLHTVQKMKFSIKDFFRKCDQIRSSLTFTAEIPNWKLHFLCNEGVFKYY